MVEITKKMPNWKQKLMNGEIDHQVQGWILKQMLRHIGRDISKCECCGRPWPETRGSIHHLDENPKNNKPDNLLLVCKKCHDKLHLRNPPRVKHKKIWCLGSF